MKARVPLSVITRRLGFGATSRFKWAGRPVRDQQDDRPLTRYACVGSCRLRFLSRAFERACRQCGGAVEGRGAV